MENKEFNRFIKLSGKVLLWPLLMKDADLKSSLLITIICAPFTSFIWFPSLLIGNYLDWRKAHHHL